MSQIILDFGSGNTCLNDLSIVIQMIDELRAIDTKKYNVIIKWQLFKQAGENIPLRQDVFDFAYQYASKYGYKTTASVFDKESLDFLLQYDIPMVKIANNRKLDYLIDEVPRKIPIYISTNNPFYKMNVQSSDQKVLLCISNYPAQVKEYEEKFDPCTLRDAISDHTIGLDLFKKYQPRIWEKHYVLEHDVNNLDGGLFAITPSDLVGIL
jgi:sialic acid synthase SpsE